jgi:hypothetical protein
MNGAVTVSNGRMASAGITLPASSRLLSFMAIPYRPECAICSEDKAQKRQRQPPDAVPKYIL